MISFVFDRLPAGIVHQGLLRVRVDPFSVVGIEALAATRLFSKSKPFRTSMERDP